MGRVPACTILLGVFRIWLIFNKICKMELDGTSRQDVFKTEELREYAISMLADKGVLMDDSALEYLGTFLREASRSPLFHGTESVGRICESILLKRGKKAGSRPMNGQNLKNVIASSGYDEIYKEKAGKTAEEKGKTGSKTEKERSQLPTT